ncbi:MAG: hypothetical protein JXR95_01375 [Deltaproteobacteria bacterium]|nr:hypothetical protein [Deltaproteobacteria bacterium]
MEGGVLTHIIEVSHGKNIYRSPGADFIPFAYTPLYYYINVPLFTLYPGYFFPRMVSIFSVTGTGILLFFYLKNKFYRFFLIKTSHFFYPTIFSSALLSLFLLDFFFTGSFVDLARVDSLWLFFVFAGSITIIDADDFRTGIISGILLSCAFWTKQTAVFFIISAGLWSIYRSIRAFTGLFITTAILCGLSTLIFNYFSDGWFWFYIRTIHKTHTFSYSVFWPETPVRLLERYFLLFSASSLFLLYKFVRDRVLDHYSIFFLILALTGIWASSTSMATQWAHTNALIPGSFFILTLFVWTFHESVAYGNSKISPVFTVIFAAVFIIHTWVRFPKENLFRKHTPDTHSHIRAKKFISFLKQFRNENILIPYHPFLSYRITGKYHFHMHALNDIRASGMKTPDSIHVSMKNSSYNYIVHDRKGRIYYNQLPWLWENYILIRNFREYKIKTWSGNPCGSRYLWKRR